MHPDSTRDDATARPRKGEQTRERGADRSSGLDLAGRREAAITHAVALACDALARRDFGARPVPPGAVARFTLGDVALALDRARVAGHAVAASADDVLDAMQRAELATADGTDADGRPVFALHLDARPF